MRRASRIDATQQEIVEVLKAFGCQILYLHQVGGGCPDLLVNVPAVCMEWRSGSNRSTSWQSSKSFKSRLWLIECKTRTGKLRQAQQALIDAGWPIVVLRSAEEAEQWLRG